MKVKCKNIYNQITKKFQESSSELTIGKEYIILEMGVYPSKKIWYRLVGDNKEKMPTIQDSSQFDVLTGNIPSSWKIAQVKEECLMLGPEIWRKPDFWVECYDRDPAALEIYRREARVIYEESEERNE
jgi:hypothetical protein